jgi:hypothetical protein
LCRLAPLLAAVAAAACGGPRVTADWSDPEFAGRSLSGERVLVLCDAASTAIKRNCLERLSSEMAAAGARPAVAAETAGYGTAPLPVAERMVAARDAGASAILTATVTPEATYARGGPDVSFGVGGWSGSRGSVSGAGVGIGVPVGGGQVDTAYAADFALTDVASGRLMWSGRVTVPASANAGSQIKELVRAGVESARSAGFL